MTVGLAGKACAGKDTLVPFFLERGFTLIDADKVGHQALVANQEAVLARFGTLDRAALGKIVFSDPQALADLEAITHPWIDREIARQVAQAPGNSLINAALLHKLRLHRLCDVVVWVQAPLLTRLLRARSRDGWPWKRIFQRIWAQRKLRSQVFGPDVDIVIVDNQGSPDQARRTLEARFKEDTHEKQ